MAGRASPSLALSKPSVLFCHCTRSDNHKSHFNGILSYLNSVAGQRLLMASKLIAHALPAEMVCTWRFSYCPLALSGSHDSTLCLWNLDNGGLVHKLEGHFFAVLCLCVDWRSSRAWSGSQDGTLRLWDLQKGISVRCLNAKQLVESIAVDWLTHRALTCSRTELNLWDLNAGLVLKSFSSHASVVCIFTHPGLTFALIGCTDCRHQLDQPPDNTALVLWNVCNTTRACNLREYSQVNCLAVDWISRQACTGVRTGRLRLWSLDTGACLQTLPGHGKAVSCVHVDWRLQRALSASNDQTMRLWDLSRGTFLREWRDLGVVLCMALKTHRAQCVLVGTGVGRGRRGKVQLRNLKSNQVLWETARHKAQVLCLAANFDD